MSRLYSRYRILNGVTPGPWPACEISGSSVVPNHATVAFLTLPLSWDSLWLLPAGEEKNLERLHGWRQARDHPPWAHTDDVTFGSSGTLRTGLVRVS